MPTSPSNDCEASAHRTLLRVPSLLATCVLASQSTGLMTGVLNHGSNLTLLYCFMQIHCIPSYFCLVWGLITTILGAIGGLRGIINSASGYTFYQ